MNSDRRCIKCGYKKWVKDRIITDELGFFHLTWKCKRCGYVYNVVDYIKVSRIDASTITAT